MLVVLYLKIKMRVGIFIASVCILRLKVLGLEFEVAVF
jgi:hypothetical protein